MLDKDLQEKIIAKNREFTRGYQDTDPYIVYTTPVSTIRDKEKAE